MPKTCLVFLLFALTALTPRLVTAENSWLLDEEKFHVSVHGQVSCADCHETTGAEGTHPDPERVNTGPAEFHAEQCLACHDNVMEDLTQGEHGSRPIRNAAEYQNCLACHNPHYAARSVEGEGAGYDPARPARGQCGVCHEERRALPAPSPEDEACMTCHRLLDPSDPAVRDRISGLCLHCHGAADSPAQRITGRRIAPIDPQAYARTAHAEVSCTLCHPAAPAYGHGRQEPGDCRLCHAPHDEKTAHDAHVQVACQSCHLKGVKPSRDPQSKRIVWKREGASGAPSEIHSMRVRERDGETCRRCHFAGNGIGAAAMVLPAKGVLCMPCHAATFSLGDTVTALSLIVFVLGIFLTLSYLLSGRSSGGGEQGFAGKLLSLPGAGLKALCSPRLPLILRTVVWDVLCQRRLLRQSAKRWVIHGLIFYPFVLRFIWGILALLGSLWRPESPWVAAMLDKNNPGTALIFDLSGMMLILGVALAFFRGMKDLKERPSGLPGQDRPALALIAGIVLLGFVLEGMRIAMTGHPPGSAYAFLGYGLSMAFSGPAALTGLYGYLWYAHAILTGLFVAYIPFSRLSHMIFAPLILIMGSIGEAEHGRATKEREPAGR